MKKIVKSALLCLWAVPVLTSASQAKVSTVPRSIARAQAALIEQGTCEDDWADQGETQLIDLDRDYQAWIVPCAHWAFNQGFTVYLTISEPSRPEGHLLKPIFFVNYSLTQGIYADNVIHNVQWDEARHSLFARYYPNGNDTCGSQAHYEWNSGQQNFVLKELLKQDDCSLPNAAWASPLSAP